MASMNTMNDAPKKSTRFRINWPPYTIEYKQMYRLIICVPLPLPVAVTGEQLCGKGQTGTAVCRPPKWPRRFTRRKTYRRNVHQSNQIAHKRHTEHHVRRFPLGKLITNHRCNAGAHCNIAADAEHKQHKEEQHGEYLFGGRRPCERNSVVGDFGMKRIGE